MQLRISPSMRSITISNGGLVDSMKLRVGPAAAAPPPLLPSPHHHHHTSSSPSSSAFFSYRSLFYLVLFCACLLPFVFIRTALVTLEGLECSSLDCFKRHIGPSIFGKSNSNSKKLVKELYEVLHSVDREEVPLSENLPDTFHEFMSQMKNNKYDARTFAVKLKATMENMNTEIKKSRLSEQLFKHYAASAVPRGIHCLSLRLTDEYSSNAHARKQLPPPELLPILSNNTYRHVVLATDNILAASVVVSSAVKSSRNAEKMVFHIITDKKTYPGMHSWFALHPVSPAIVEVKSVHQFGWLTRENVPVLEALENHNFVRSHYHGNRALVINGGDDNPRVFASKLQARSPMYISLLNHLRIFLPELFPNLDKVLFLDDDVVIQRDLLPLWEIDLQGKVMGAVETCNGDDKWVMSKRFRTYFNFSHPQIVANLDPNECPWAFGMNIFDLSAWRKTNIRETFHFWVKENIKSGLTLWKFGTLPPALIAFRGHVHPIDPSWHMLGLGYQENSKIDNVRNAAVIHYNGQCKPWLDIGFKHLKPFWTKHVNYSSDFKSDEPKDRRRGNAAPPSIEDKFVINYTSISNIYFFYQPATFYKMDRGIRWKDEEAQVVEDDEGKTEHEEIRGEENFQIQFHLHDGSDIGPTSHSAETRIINLKETILPQWPPGFANAPQSVQDFKLIYGGQALEDDKKLKEYLNSPAAFAGITTIHVVMKPPSGIKLLQMRLMTTARRFGCVIM